MTAPSPSAEIPYLRLPEPALLFEGRAARLAALAAPAPGAAPEADAFLTLLARIAGGQADAARALRARGGAVRDALLAIEALPFDAALAPALEAVLAAARRGPLPPPAESAVRALADAGAGTVARLAEAVLSGALPEPQRAAAPFVGAALQVAAASRVARLDPAGVPRALVGCPCCGSPPVAGVVQGDDRLRYLTCGLCGADWHLARLHCASCRSNEGLSYRHLEHDPGARAETCDRCRSYVKLFDLEKRPGAEPLADDAATLPLDLLLGEEGYGRGGVNLLLGPMPPPAA